MRDGTCGYRTGNAQWRRGRDAQAAAEQVTEVTEPTISRHGGNTTVPPAGRTRTLNVRPRKRWADLPLAVRFTGVVVVSPWAWWRRAAWFCSRGPRRSLRRGRAVVGVLIPLAVNRRCSWRSWRWRGADEAEYARARGGCVRTVCRTCGGWAMRGCARSAVVRLTQSVIASRGRWRGFRGRGVGAARLGRGFTVCARRTCSRGRRSWRRCRRSCPDRRRRRPGRSRRS